MKIIGYTDEICELLNAIPAYGGLRTPVQEWAGSGIVGQYNGHIIDVELLDQKYGTERRFASGSDACGNVFITIDGLSQHSGMRIVVSGEVYGSFFANSIDEACEKIRAVVPKNSTIAVDSRCFGMALADSLARFMPVKYLRPRSIDSVISGGI